MAAKDSRRPRNRPRETGSCTVRGGSGAGPTASPGDFRHQAAHNGRGLLAELFPEQALQVVVLPARLSGAAGLQEQPDQIGARLLPDRIGRRGTMGVVHGHGQLAQRPACQRDRAESAARFSPSRRSRSCRTQSS